MVIKESLRRTICVVFFAAYDMDVPSAKRFITSLLESRVEEAEV